MARIHLADLILIKLNKVFVIYYLHQYSVCHHFYLMLLWKLNILTLLAQAEEITAANMTQGPWECNLTSRDIERIKETDVKSHKMEVWCRDERDSMPAALLLRDIKSDWRLIKRSRKVDRRLSEKKSWRVSENTQTLWKQSRCLKGRSLNHKESTTDKKWNR